MAYIPGMDSMAKGDTMTQPLNRRKTDATTDLEAIMAANRDAVAQSWAREFADESSPWHRLALGYPCRCDACAALRD